VRAGNKKNASDIQPVNHSLYRLRHPVSPVLFNDATSCRLWTCSIDRKITEIFIVISGVTSCKLRWAIYWKSVRTSKIILCLYHPRLKTLVLFLILSVTRSQSVGRDSVFGRVVRYGLDDPAMDSPRDEIFAHPSRPALRPTQSPVQWVACLSRGWIGRGVTHPNPSSAEFKKTVEIYVYSPSEASWPVIG
jgi:hypothetical protein